MITVNCRQQIWNCIKCITESRYCNYKVAYLYGKKIRYNSLISLFTRWVPGKYNFEDFKRIVPYSYNHVQLPVYRTLNQLLLLCQYKKKLMRQSFRIFYLWNQNSRTSRVIFLHFIHIISFVCIVPPSLVIYLWTHD